MHSDKPAPYRIIAQVTAASSVATTVKAVSVTCIVSLRPLSIRIQPVKPIIMSRIVSPQKFFAYTQ